MGIPFGCNPQVIFFHFFAVMTQSFFSLKHLPTGYLVNATPTVFVESFYNFAGVFVKI